MVGVYVLRVKPSVRNIFKRSSITFTRCSSIYFARNIIGDVKSQLISLAYRTKRVGVRYVRTAGNVRTAEFHFIKVTTLPNGFNHLPSPNRLFDNLVL